MATKWEDIYKRFLKSDKDTLLRVAKDQAGKMLNYFTAKGATKEQAFATFVAIYSTFVASDGYASLKEIEMFNKIFELKLSEKQFMNLTRSGMEMKEKSKSFIARSDVEFKTMVVNFGCAVSAYDGKMTDSEKKLIQYYAEA